ncbi:MAG: ABC transporter substrate-binding protein, partial [Dehalococcoidia bacterium]
YKGESTSEFEPRLASEWDIVSDGTEYRFKIREGVKFHDGSAPLKMWNTPSSGRWYRTALGDQSGCFWNHSSAFILQGTGRETSPLTSRI